MAKLVRQQLRARNQRDARGSRAAAVQAQARNQLVRVFGSCNDGVGDGVEDVGEEQKGPPAKEVRVGAEEEDCDCCGGRDAGDDPGGELRLAEALEEGGGDVGSCGCAPERGV